MHMDVRFSYAFKFKMKKFTKEMSISSCKVESRSLAQRIPQPYVGEMQSKARISESLPHSYSHSNPTMKSLTLEKALKIIKSNINQTLPTPPAGHVYTS